MSLRPLRYESTTPGQKEGKILPFPGPEPDIDLNAQVGYALASRLDYAVEANWRDVAKRIVASMAVTHTLEPLVDRVAAIERRLDLLLAKHGAEEIVLEEVPREEAKARVLAWYQGHKNVETYPSDVAVELRIDAFLVYQITEELVAEGKLR